jgi:hypothetical protein
VRLHSGPEHPTHLLVPTVPVAVLQSR